LVWHYRIYRRKGIWLSPSAAEKLGDFFSATTLHAHSRDAAQQGFYQACRTAKAGQALGLPTHYPRSWMNIWNRGAEDLYGWERGEVSGKVTHDLLRSRHPESVEALEAALMREGYWDGELVHTTRDGREILIDSRHIVTQTEDGRRLVLEMNRDVTARRQAEADLQASEARYRQLSDELEQRVRERTSELARTVDALHLEIEQREQAERASRAQTRTLVSTIEQLTQEHELKEFPGLVLAAIVDQLGGSEGSLWIYDEATDVSQMVLDYEGGQVVTVQNGDAGDPDGAPGGTGVPDGGAGGAEPHGPGDP
jgi:PAS domain S-box-containing protein